MQFDAQAFFGGFIECLKNERSSTLAYASVIASPEAWIQFEALDWLHRNRDPLGLGGGNPQKPAYDVWAEERKNDIWLQDCRGVPNRTGMALEFKVVFNNKNFWEQVKGLRWDVSPAKRPADDFTDQAVERLGVAFLVYLRYAPGFGSKYVLLRNESRGVPTSADEFVSKFLSECASSEPSYGSLPRLSQISDVERIVTLDDQPYIARDMPGCSVWAVMMKAV